MNLWSKPLWSDSSHILDLSLPVMAWMFLSFQNSYVEILTTTTAPPPHPPQGDAIRRWGGALGRWLGYEGEVLKNGINVLMKKTPESSYHVRTHPEVSSLQSESGLSIGPWSPTSSLQNHEREMFVAWTTKSMILFKIAAHTKMLPKYLLRIFSDHELNWIMTDSEVIIRKCWMHGFQECGRSTNISYWLVHFLYITMSDPPVLIKRPSRVNLTDKFHPGRRCGGGAFYCCCSVS